MFLLQKQCFSFSFLSSVISLDLQYSWGGSSWLHYSSQSRTVFLVLPFTHDGHISCSGHAQPFSQLMTDLFFFYLFLPFGFFNYKECEFFQISNMYNPSNVVCNK